MKTERSGKRPVQGPGPVRTVPPPLPDAGVRAKQVTVSQGPARPRRQKLPFWKKGINALLSFAKNLVYVIVPVTMLAGMAAGIIYVRLRHGPISFDFMVPPVERGINAELVNNTVKIEGAELQMSDTGALEFRLRRLTIFDRDGDAIGGSPLAAVNISAAALWNLRIVPARVELIDPVINLIYTDAGVIALDEVITPPAPKPASRLDGESAPSASPPAAATDANKAPPKPLNIAKLLSDTSSRARRRLDATSYLTELGVRNATINLDYHGKESSWKVLEASVDLDHARRRSVISGRAKVASDRGPWALSFVSDETEKTDRLQVKATVRDLVPATLASAVPPLALMSMVDLPIAGDATVELSTNGDILKAALAIEAGRGRIKHPDIDEPFPLTGALLKLAYDGAQRTWDLLPSPVKWDGGSVLFSGRARDVAKASEAPTWQYVLDGRNAVMEAAEFGVAPVQAEVWSARGAVVPRRGLIDIVDARFVGGGASIQVSATTEPGEIGQSTRADVKISPMPLATLKAIWPRAAAPGARKWVGENVSAADFKGGTVNFLTGDYLKGEPIAPGAKPERLTVAVEAENAVFIPLPGVAPIHAPKGLIRIDNNALDIVVPEAEIVLPDDRRVPLKAGHMTAADVLLDRPQAQIAFTSEAALEPFLETVEQLPVRAVRESAPFPKAAEGKVKADIDITLPLIDRLAPDDVVITGKARITDGRFGKVAGQFDVQGFTLALELSQTALTANGDLLVNGVPGKINGEHVFGLTQQPPITVEAKLDDADRNQLGLDINDIVRGVVPVEISLQKSDRSESTIKLKADLTDAEVALDPISWRKAPGRKAAVEADITTGKQNRTELQNLKVTGDDIAVEGWVIVGPDHKMREFSFPTFTLNVISRLAIQGKLGSDQVWNVKANGPTFDARDVFRSLFSLNKSTDAKASGKKASRGTDLSVTVGNVIGANDISMRNFRMTLSSRSEKLAAFDAKGTLDGGAVLAAELDTSSGGRRLLVDSMDGGQVMKLIGFYPNMQEGRLRLEVNLDGRGAAEKTGILWVDDFKVLGDPIVSEVVSSAGDDGRPAIGGGKKVVREVFKFDRMRAPFSIGYGQFVLEESYLKGPLVGANLRGKVDFKLRRVSIGGTYIPLQGLNGALGGIPLLGQLISGAHGEGIFGITFAVQGNLANPQVIVNPLSLVAPGIFREVFQMTSQNPRVQVREDQIPATPVEQRVRANVPAKKSKAAKRKRQPQPSATVDGWSSTTKGSH